MRNSSTSMVLFWKCAKGSGHPLAHPKSAHVPCLITTCSHALFRFTHVELRLLPNSSSPWVMNTSLFSPKCASLTHPQCQEPGVMAHAWTNAQHLGVKSWGKRIVVSLRTAWVTQWVQSQPNLAQMFLKSHKLKCLWNMVNPAEGAVYQVKQGCETQDSCPIPRYRCFIVTNNNATLFSMPCKWTFSIAFRSQSISTL